MNQMEGMLDGKAARGLVYSMVERLEKTPGLNYTSELRLKYKPTLTDSIRTSIPYDSTWYIIVEFESVCSFVEAQGPLRFIITFDHIETKKGEYIPQSKAAGVWFAHKFSLTMKETFKDQNLLVVVKLNPFSPYCQMMTVTGRII